MSNIVGCDNEVRRCRFAIVGAGMAGLGAAYALQQLGIEDFLILEAQDKPGGRISTLDVENGSVIDLGAQWIHGVHTHIYNLAKQNDLISNITSNEGEGLYVRNDGVIYDDFLILRVDFEVGRILEKCEKFIDLEGYPESIGSYLNTEFEQYIKRSPEDEGLKREVFDWHFRFQEIDNSCKDLRKLSAKAWGLYSCLGKDGQQHINLKQGYGTIMDSLMKTIPKSKVLLNIPIDTILYDDDVILTGKNNVKICAEHVIVTVSMGVLKAQHKSLFRPNLPSLLQNTIDAMGFDGLGKIFLLFESKWWHAEGFQLLWRKDACVSKDLEWTKCISGFDTVQNQRNMLLGWVSHNGCEIMERLEPEVVGRNCVDLLRIFLKDNSIPYPKKVFRTTWILNPYIRGGYSHVTSSCDALGLDMGVAQTLAQPVLDGRGTPRVMLAGEAVHARHFSTTHGAFESGVEQAQRLVEMIKDKIE